MRYGINLNSLLIFIFLSSLGSPIKPKLDHFIFHDGYFYAYAKNRYEIVKLDTQGNLVASIGRRGRGPAEFSAPDINMTFGGDTLFAYDALNKRLTALNKNLKVIKEQFPKNLIDHIIYFNRQLYSNTIDFSSHTDKNANRSAEYALKMEKESDFKIKSLDGSNKLLATYHNKVITPLYSRQKVKSNGHTFVIFHPNQNKIRFYYHNLLQIINLKSIEPLSIGRKMELSNHAMKVNFGAYPYFPLYSVIENILLTHHHSIIIQIKSYKKGSRVLFYDLNNKKVTQIIPSPRGKLIGRDSTYFYFYTDNSIKKYMVSELTNCSNTHLTFYIGAFREQCELCKQSFFKIYDWVRRQNMPYNFVVKDNHWFGSVDKDDYRSVVDYMHQWNVWGAVQFEDNCPNCFKNGMHVRINGGSLKALPLPVKKVQSAVSCK